MGRRRPGELRKEQGLLHTDLQVVTETTPYGDTSFRVKGRVALAVAPSLLGNFTPEAHQANRTSSRARKAKARAARQAKKRTGKK